MRRLLLASAVAAAAALVAASVVSADDTLGDGTLEVYNSSDFPSCAAAAAANQCSKRQDGGAVQTGMALFDNAGESITIAASDFNSATYVTTWRHPGSTANCHRSQTGTDPQVIVLDASETGPSFTITTTSPNTSGRTVPTGLARICVQDYEYDPSGFPSVVSSQFVDVAVTL